MSQTSFCGSFKTDDVNIILAILREWLQIDTFKIQDRLAGMEIVYEATDIYVFCQEECFVPEGKHRSYLIQGKIDAPLAEAAERLRPLLYICKTKHIECILEYVLIDAAGEQISEEMSLQ